MKRTLLIWLSVVILAMVVLALPSYFLGFKLGQGRFSPDTSSSSSDGSNSGSSSDPISNDSSSTPSPAISGATKLTGLIGKKNKTSQSTNSQRRGLVQEWSRGQCQGSGPVKFTHYPMNLTDVGIILPYGLMADGHVTPIDHMYFSPQDFQSPRDKYPVFAIADGTIVNISHRANFVGDAQLGRPTDEYRLDIEYTCGFYSYYDLVTSLSPTLLTQAIAALEKMGKQSELESNWTVSQRIAIKAGEEIGRIGGQTLDWAVYNSSVKQPFIVPEHYDREIWKVNTDLKAFDYFSAELQPDLYKLLARQVEPRLGQIAYDIDGYAVGNWFKVGTNGYAGSDQQRYWDGHLSLVYD